MNKHLVLGPIVDEGDIVSLRGRHAIVTEMHLDPLGLDDRLSLSDGRTCLSSDIEARQQYLADGRILAARPSRDGRLIVIVDCGGVLPYCVAEYTPGADERHAGTYYADLTTAVKAWSEYRA